MEFLPRTFFNVFLFFFQNLSSIIFFMNFSRTFNRNFFRYSFKNFSRIFPKFLLGYFGLFFFINSSRNLLRNSSWIFSWNISGNSCTIFFRFFLWDSGFFVFPRVSPGFSFYKLYWSFFRIVTNKILKTSPGILPEISWGIYPGVLSEIPPRFFREFLKDLSKEVSENLKDFLEKFVKKALLERCSKKPLEMILTNFCKNSLSYFWSNFQRVC